MQPVEVSAWAGAVATLLAVLVALFKEEIVRLWRKPVLHSTIRLKAPDCHKTQMAIIDKKTGSVLARPDCYYFRLWVENIGNQRAEKVQVFASKLFRRHADGTFREEQPFLPMNLKWSHSQLTASGPEVFAEGISPHMGKHCDLGHIVDPQYQGIVGEALAVVPSGKTVMAFDLEIAPNTLSHLIPPAVYRLDLKLAAANLAPVTKTIEITLTGDWYADESRMFSDGIGLKEIK